MRFFEQLQARAKQQCTLLCVGLDPRPERFPTDVLADQDPIYAFNLRIIDATRDLVCAYKPNYAFYEAHGLEGLRALRRTIDYIGDDIPVILDAKRGDIGSTSAALARAAFEVWGAGAVTVAPYLGGDSVTPFTDYADRGVFVLCHTSNPGASELQTLVCESPVRGGSEPLHLRVARLSQGWSTTDNVGLVVGATYPEALRAVRSLAPQAWFLVPGIGTQGGDLGATVVAGLRADGLGLVINVSRAVCHADDPRAAARQFRDQINGARQHLARACIPPASNAPSPRPGGAVMPTGEVLERTPTALEDEGSERLQELRADAPSPRPGGAGAADPQTAMILDLARIGAVRFGQFTLKSGATSPVYIDLRLLASYPEVLGRVAAAYAEVLHSLEYDRIAAIPYAALPIGTAVALQTGHPLIYPRKEIKGYGTQRAIEGAYEAGERVVVLDDLITTGESKLETIAPLKDAGLEMEDVVVLIDREGGGQETLAREGVRLHAVLTLRRILDVLAQHGTISEEQKAHVMDWLAEQ
jgi:uridine monophosphate synthetase